MKLHQRILTYAIRSSLRLKLRVLAWRTRERRVTLDLLRTDHAALAIYIDRLEQRQIAELVGVLQLQARIANLGV